MQNIWKCEEKSIVPKLIFQFWTKNDWGSFSEPFQKKISSRHQPIDLKISLSRIKSAIPISYNCIQINSVN